MLDAVSSNGVDKMAVLDWPITGDDVTSSKVEEMTAVNVVPKVVDSDITITFDDDSEK